MLKWTESEIIILKKTYHGSSKEEICKLLPNRLWGQITRKSRSLSLKRDPIVAYGRWTTDEINYLKENYSSASKEELLEKLPKTWQAITIQASNLKLKRKSKRVWTKSELKILERLYPLEEKTIICDQLPNRSWVAIILQAGRCSIKRELVVQRQNHLENLLQETPEAYYWVGFLAADGHLSLKNRVILGLGKKDRIHLVKFAKFIEVPTISDENHKFVVKAQHKEAGIAIRKKFSFHKRKTYHPPDSLPDCNLELLISYIIGFIDGDGCLKQRHNRPDWNLSIKLHSSWKNLLQKITNTCYQQLNKIAPTAKINKDGYVVATMGDSTILKYLKRHIIKYNLPSLNRKWDQIDLNYVARQERAQNRRAVIKKMLKKGVSQTKIAKHLGMSNSSVSQAIKVYKLK